MREKGVAGCGGQRRRRSGMANEGDMQGRWRAGTKEVQESTDRGLGHDMLQENTSIHIISISKKSQTRPSGSPTDTGSIASRHWM